MLLMAVGVLHWTSSGRLQAGWHNPAGQQHCAKILMPSQRSSGHMALCPHCSALFIYTTYIDHCTDTAIVCLVLLLVSSSWVWLLLSEYRHFLQPYRVDVHWFDHYTSSHICTFGSWRIIRFPEFLLTFLSFYLRVSLHKKIDFVYIQGKKPPRW